MKNRLLHLDGLRGLLAVSVVLGHWLGSRLGWGNVNFMHSYISVDGFFILSGFVLAYVYGDKIKQKKISLVKYSFHRLARLYPLHILTLLMTYCIYKIFFGAMPFAAPFETFIYNIFLLHGMGLAESWNWNDPSWSISVEFFASVLALPFLIKIRSNVTLAAIAAVGYILVTSVHHNLMAATDLHLYFFSSGFLKSVSGMALGVMTMNMVKSSSKKSANNPLCTFVQAAEILIISFFIYTKMSITSYDLIIVIAFTHLLYSLTTNETTFKKILSSQIISGLGKISFSVYLIHTPIMLLLDQISSYSSAGFYTQTAIFMTTLTITSIITYNFFEIITYNFLKNKIDNSRRIK